MIDLVGKRFWWLLISAVLLVPGIISLAIPPHLRPGIEFTSGSTITLQFEQKVDQAELRTYLGQIGYGEVILQRTGEGNFLLRTREITSEVKDALLTRLKEKFGEVKALEFFSVSPIVATESAQRAALAVAITSVGILFYISLAFRKVKKSFRYGVCAIISMLFNVFVVLGVFSILGRLFSVEIDAMFIAGMLTVVGYSVHDTIVVFDRVRENSIKGVSKDFSEVVNYSLTQTLVRSLNTGLTTLFVLVALLLFGGSTIKNFILVLFIGIVIGTYSSIFNAAQLLVVWEKKEWGRLLFLRPSRKSSQAENKKAVV